MNNLKKSTEYPMISIAVANYNGRSYLEEILRPLLSLDYPNYEIFVVDNGSKDLSQDFINTLDGISLVQNHSTGSKNCGLNLAIDHAKGEYILFLDNDVLINDRDFLKKILDSYKKTFDVGLLSIALSNRGEDKAYFYGLYISRFSFIKRNKRLPINDLGSLHGKKVVGVQGASFFSKRSIFNEIGKFDELIPFGGEDVDIGIRSILMGYSNYIFSEYVPLHIGMRERSNNQIYRNKFRSSNTGLFLTILKDYNHYNLLFSFTAFLLYQFAKVIKDAFTRKDIGLVRIYFDSLAFLYINRKSILERRNVIQGNRKIQKDIFFEIKQPV